MPFSASWAPYIAKRVCFTVVRSAFRWMPSVDASGSGTAKTSGSSDHDPNMNSFGTVFFFPTRSASHTVSTPSPVAEYKPGLHSPTAKR
ncbi:Uncharacterised protein [Mycobacteroides abscessus subsp. abscessus]|nr:Uncharacterised protein [Mycobacteroides abscessus subsp. abscessus]